MMNRYIWFIVLTLISLNYTSAQTRIHFRNGETREVGSIVDRSLDYITYSNYKLIGGVFRLQGDENEVRSSDIIKIDHNGFTEHFDLEKYRELVSDQKVHKRNFALAEGSNYYVGDHWISENLWVDLLKTNPRAWSAYQTGMTLSQIARVSYITSLISGVILVGTAISSISNIFSFEDLSTTSQVLLVGSFGTLGLSAIVAGVTYFTSLYYRYSKAFDLYNQGVGTPSSAHALRLDLSVGVGSVGVALQF